MIDRRGLLRNLPEGTRTYFAEEYRTGLHGNICIDYYGSLLHLPYVPEPSTTDTVRWKHGCVRLDAALLSSAMVLVT
jgi:hypothetical protein